ncbi:metal ABC transporter solute-binding protein, Zn/Mn family [Desulfobaculum sp.]
MHVLSRCFAYTVAAFAGLVFLAGAAMAQPLSVAVSILPEKYFVERIGGDLVDVQVMVPPGSQPHFYDPKPSQMVRLNDAAVYFAIGVPFEKAWLPRFASANADMRIVNIADGLPRIPIAPHAHHHAGGEDGDHDHSAHHAAEAAENMGLNTDAHHDGAESHEGEEHHDHAAHNDHAGHHDHSADTETMDPHVWLSPRYVVRMADTIRDALILADPVNAKAYKAGHAAFISDVTALHMELTATFDHAPDEEDDAPAPVLSDGARTFMVFHPSWGYFARDYNLRQLPIEQDGKEPSPRDLAHLIATAKAKGVRVIFVQPQFARRSAEAIARGVDGTVIPADPLAYDWLANMRSVADAFHAALR